MRGMIAIVGWEDLFGSPWFMSSARCMGKRGPEGKWITPPRRGFYAVDVLQDVMWGPFNTETEATGFIITLVTRPIREASNDAGRVLH